MNEEAEAEAEVEVEEEGAVVVVEPSPDIHKLFCFYNKLYFDDALGACIVRWSSPRMTSCAGTCRFLRGGGCEIHLSEPLLKKRSTTDLKKTLLHEMIHAFLFITQNKKDRRYHHGSMFQDLMNTINSSSQADHQRPSGGYNITVYHDFHEEADSYRLHHWRCESCGDLIKRAINRKPSATDCIKKAGHGNVCGNSSCHWHSHQMSCGGTYAKIAEPPGYKDKTKASKGVQKTLDIKPEKPNVAILNNQGSHKSGVQKNLEIRLEKPNVAIPSNQVSHKSGVQKNLEIKPEKPNVVIPSNQGSHKSGVQKDLEIKPGKPSVVILSNQGSHKSEGMTDNCDTRMPHVITHFFHTTCDKKRTMHSSSLEFEKPKIVESKIKETFVVPGKQKNANSLESKKRKCNNTIRQQFGKGKKEFMVASAWLGYYADEESDEDIEPLINKRTERRKRQKILKKTMAATRENIAFATLPLDPSRSQKGSAKDFSLVPHENCDGGAQIVNVENVSAIDSDEILDAEPLDHSAPLPLPGLPYASPSKSPAQDIVIYISDDSD
uniref:SprT-like domain-containing protein n=1 Tax=Ananas comosus var. bracteatus TaxID=296719 RepID=A0A6V7P6R9_ANACO|nr:unnamed protein product [Ananas comosus var. bracteatus]